MHINPLFKNHDIMPSIYDLIKISQWLPNIHGYVTNMDYMDVDKQYLNN